MSAPRGTHAAEVTEASDTYLKVVVTTSHTRAAGTTAHGTRARNAPRPVATPLPPRKPRKIDQQLPRMAATAEAAAARSSEAATMAPSATAPAPLATSPDSVSRAGQRPAVRNTLVAPMV